MIQVVNILGIIWVRVYVKIFAMSGHSKWSTIKRQKGAADIKRGQTFTKVANSIIIAVKLGGSDNPDSNPRLRSALEAAKEVNMPKDNVQRAIDRGMGRLPGQTLEEIIYEGFGPSKVAFYIEAVTDNKLRTLQEVKNLFERSGGSLAGQGSVAYMFERKGEIKITSKGRGKDDEMLELIDLGVEDVEDFMEDSPAGEIQKYLVYIDSTKLTDVSNKLIQAGYGVESSEVMFKPNTFVEITQSEDAKKVVEFAEKLEEQDDIQKVYSNLDIPENLI